MALHARKEGTMLLVSAQGRMGEVSTPKFEENTNQSTDEGETIFIVDLSSRECIGSKGLRSILAIVGIFRERMDGSCLSVLREQSRLHLKSLNIYEERRVYVVNFPNE